MTDDTTLDLFIQPSPSHAGSMESPRLQATLAILHARGFTGATTLDISAHTGSQAVHSDVHGLRVNGYLVDCRYDGKSEQGNKIYRYKLLGRK